MSALTNGRNDDPCAFMCASCGSVTRSQRTADGTYQGIFHTGGHRDPSTKVWDDPHVIIACLGCGASKRASTNCVSRSYTKRNFDLAVSPKEVASDPTLEVRHMACKNPACSSYRVALDQPDSDALQLRYTCLACKHQWCDERPAAQKSATSGSESES